MSSPSPLELTTLREPHPRFRALGAQSDIRYHAVPAGKVLNAPEQTGMGFWSINPYIGCAFGCTYCYARYAHRYVMERGSAAGALEPGMRSDVERLPPWMAFERRILVKERAPDALRAALASGGARHRTLRSGESIVIGTATDPYQPAERRFRVTRGLLEVLAEHRGLEVVIITKSPLVTRDIDVLSRLAVRSSFTLHLSLITLDRELARRIEPRAPTPDARLRALGRLTSAGIEVGVNCMPVLPGITDDPRALERLVRAVADHGASYVGACALRLRGSARARYLPFIDREFPALRDRYRTQYAASHQVNDRYRQGLARLMERLCARYGLRWRSYRTEDEDAERHAPPPATSQLELL
ncbi:MAG TPA: radical SAM protein [Gemmatimonadaceae bacterium]|nr:radical SAM protein [Gemmatimonadaceae bacterium]